jgi:hypothetical protein
MNFQKVLLAAKVANAAYIGDLTEATNAFGVLGYGVLDRYRDNDHQVYLLSSAEGMTLAIAGTRVLHSIGDLKDDLDFSALNISAQGAGIKVAGRVANGAFKGMHAIAHWAGKIVGDANLGGDATFDIIGHSLGGERALLCACFVSPKNVRGVYAFESPKCADEAFWASAADYLLKTTVVVNGNDLWAGWPFVSEWSHPPILHMHLLGDGKYELVMPDALPTMYSPADHDIEAVIKRLEDITTAAPSGALVTG